MLGYLPPSRPSLTVVTKSAPVYRTKCIGGQHIFVLFVLCLQVLIPTSFASKKTKEDDTLKKPCDNCRELVQKFIEEFKLTDRGLYEGGDTDWELKNLKDYRKSEVRFIEITEKIYQSKVAHVTRLLEDVEESLEEFWRDHWQHVGDSNELDSFLCVSLKKFCCPFGFFGTDCSPCESGQDDNANCSDHGTCNGNGTRSGTGQCNCDDGYRGSFCEECKKGYKREEETKICVDIDECGQSKNPCEEGKFCKNQPGYYSCKTCHEACANLTCSGPEPENCTGGVCADGYDKMVAADGVSIIGCTTLDDDEDLGENDDDINSGANANVSSDDVNDDADVKENITTASTDEETSDHLEGNENGTSLTEGSQDEMLAEETENHGKTRDDVRKTGGIDAADEKSGSEDAPVLNNEESLEPVADLSLNENLVEGSSKTEKNIEL